MMDIEDRQASVVDPVSRRSILRVGSAFIAAIATLSSPKAAAADCQGSPCCDLASCTRCNFLQCGGWYCPPGYHQTCWNCYTGGKWYVCGECSYGTDCHSGPWYCSVWFQQQGPGC